MMLKPKGRNDGHVFDYTKISENVYVGSDLCSGRNCPAHDREFKSLGVTTEINLSAEKKETPPEEIEVYSWIPVVDGYSPNQSQLDMGTSIINDSVSSKDTVYVHCKNGHGRSPSLVIAYLMRFRGMTYEDAHSLVKEKRPEIHIEETQRKALEEFSRRHKTS